MTSDRGGNGAVSKEKSGSSGGKEGYMFREQLGAGGVGLGCGGRILNSVGRLWAMQHWPLGYINGMWKVGCQVQRQLLLLR